MFDKLLANIKPTVNEMAQYELSDWLMVMAVAALICAALSTEGTIMDLFGGIGGVYIVWRLYRHNSFFSQ